MKIFTPKKIYDPLKMQPRHFSYMAERKIIIADELDLEEKGISRLYSSPMALLTGLISSFEKMGYDLEIAAGMAYLSIYELDNIISETNILSYYLIMCGSFPVTLAVADKLARSLDDIDDDIKKIHPIFDKSNYSEFAFLDNVKIFLDKNKFEKNFPFKGAITFIEISCIIKYLIRILNIDISELKGFNPDYNDAVAKKCETERLKMLDFSKTLATED